MFEFIKSLFSRKQKIVASMATVPWRENTLQQAVESLLPQVDSLNVYLNEWDSIPDFLNHSKINAVMSQDEVGDLGAKGKFYWCEKVRGIHLTVDDDILYPPNYVEKLLQGLEKYPKAVISFHGSILKSEIFKERNNKESHFARDTEEDIAVTLIGTGVMGYDSTKLDVKFDEFKSNNWADGWFSLQARNANFRCIVMKHNKDWIIPLPTEGPDIWSMNREEDMNSKINQWIKEYHLWDDD